MTAKIPERRQGVPTVVPLLFAIGFLVLFVFASVSGVTTVKETTVETSIRLPALFFSLSSASILFIPIALVSICCAIFAMLKGQRNVAMMFSFVTFASFLAFILLFGRMLCGFLCPMGFAQDIMHKIRQATRVEGIAMSDRMYQALVPVRWTMLLLMLGLCFVGGNFCNFCPAIALSPVAAGLSVSLYASGFLMVFVLIASFFKRRFFCTICPLGYLMGLAHKVQPFRIRKDCTACTECGACYEACPMGIKQIYTEREQADVTDINCIMCGECVRCCPEDKALSLTFLGKGLYVSKRSRVVKEFGGRNDG